MTRKELEKRCREEMQQNIPDKDALWMRIEQNLPAQQETEAPAARPHITMQHVYKALLTAACLLVVVGAGGVLSVLYQGRNLETANSEAAKPAQNDFAYNAVQEEAAEEGGYAEDNEEPKQDTGRSSLGGITNGVTAEGSAAPEEAGDDEKAASPAAEGEGGSEEEAYVEENFTADGIWLMSGNENIADASLVLMQEEPAYDVHDNLFYFQYYVSTAFIRQYIDEDMTFDGSVCTFRTGHETVTIEDSMVYLTNDVFGDDGVDEIGFFDRDGERYFHVTAHTDELFHLTRSVINGGQYTGQNGKTAYSVMYELEFRTIPQFSYTVERLADSGYVYQVDTYTYEGGLLSKSLTMDEVAGYTHSGAIIYLYDGTYVAEYEGNYLPLTLTDSRSKDVPK